MSGTTVADAADYGAFIPRQLDDYPLDVYEFRVYCHVVRRAGKGYCSASHASMAAHCHMTLPRLRTALEVLVGTGLLRRSLADKTFHYVRTNHDDWTPASEVAGVRLSISAKRRDTRMRTFTQTGSVQSGSVQDGSRLGGGTDPVWAPGTDPVWAPGTDPDYKGTPYEGTPYEGTPYEGVLSQARDAIAPPPSAGNLENSPEPDSLDQLASLSGREKSHLLEAQALQGAKGSAAAKRPKKTKAEAIYARLSGMGQLDAFEAFWSWYRVKICEIAPSSPGGKAEAAAAWLRLVESDFAGAGYEAFKAGCLIEWRSAIATRGVGVPHACRFLLPGSGEPKWLESLRQEQCPSEPDQFLDGVQPPSPVTLPVADRQLIERAAAPNPLRDEMRRRLQNNPYLNKKGGVA